MRAARYADHAAPRSPARRLHADRRYFSAVSSGIAIVAHSRVPEGVACSRDREPLARPPGTAFARGATGLTAVTAQRTPSCDAGGRWSRRHGNRAGFKPSARSFGASPSRGDAHHGVTSVSRARSRACTAAHAPDIRGRSRVVRSTRGATRDPCRAPEQGRHGERELPTVHLMPPSEAEATHWRVPGRASSVRRLCGPHLVLSHRLPS